MGTILIKSHPAIILFDSRATLSFIDKKFMLNSKLEMQNLQVPYHIESPGGEIIARHLLVRFQFSLRELLFETIFSF